MEVLVVGGGGREHALAWKISQSPKVNRIFCAPGNAGTAIIGENIKYSIDDIEGLLSFADKRRIGLTVIGPEQPLVNGIVDRFNDRGLRIFGPSAKAAQIEGSKSFCKNLLQKHGIPTGEYETFNSSHAAQEYIRGKGLIVIKADGLAAGKGVLICQKEIEALQAIDEIINKKIFGEAGNQLIIEEFLEGTEVSLLAFTDGKYLLPLDLAQDYKTAYDGNKGPNTGGMGAFSPVIDFPNALKEQIMAEIMYPTLKAMETEGSLYQGLLYAGLMLTQQGPKVLEFNARFGDPETQSLMTRLKTDIVDVMEATIDGNLNQLTLDWDKRYSVCIVMATKGYPHHYKKGMRIEGLNDAEKIKDVKVFHAGTKQEGDKVFTNGGRVLGVSALGDNMYTAANQAYEAAKKIRWDGIFYRKDIGITRS